MFGYIKPHVPELKVSSYELYRSVYCGLCRVAGKRVSRFSRFFLSYDYVFLAIVRMFFTGEDFAVTKARCPYKPHKKHNELGENETMRFTAAAFALFTHYKVKDNVGDTKGIKKVLFFLLSLFTARFERKAKKLYPELKQIVDEPLARLTELEKSRDTSPDAAAATFGDMTAALLSMGLADENKTSAETAGFQIGRFIYLCDAIDDLEKDAKSDSFNPFLNRFPDAVSAREYAVGIEDIILAGMAETALLFSEYNKESSTCESGALREICVNIASLGSQITMKKILQNKS